MSFHSFGSIEFDFTYLVLLLVFIQSCVLFWALYRLGQHLGFIKRRSRK